MPRTLVATRSACWRRDHPGGQSRTVAKIAPRPIAASHRNIAGHPGSAERHGETRARVASMVAPARPYITQASAIALALKCFARVAPRGSTVTVALQWRQR
jgi:hypothetical protein